MEQSAVITVQDKLQGHPCTHCTTGQLCWSMSERDTVNMNTVNKKQLSVHDKLGHNTKYMKTCLKWMVRKKKVVKKRYCWEYLVELFNS